MATTVASAPSSTPVGGGCVHTTNNIDFDNLDEMSKQLRREALEAIELEPELSTLLYRTVLAPNVVTFEDAVAMTVCYRLLLHPQPTSNPTSSGGSSNGPMFCPNSLYKILKNAMSSSELEYGHTMSEAIREDAKAVCRRDPAFETLLEVVLFSKGYSALVCHRAARRKWFDTLAGKNKRRSFTALFLQSQASAVFGLDIHPAATLGKGIMLDHGTGIVIGETAYAGDGCTFLHGVTLGGTGKDSGDRHPKVGKNVLIGAGASILGNINLGDGCKIGAGSVVLRPIPAGATAVGSPARIIGHARESQPGSVMDEVLENVSLLHKSESSVTVSSSSMTKSTASLSSLTKDNNDNNSTRTASTTVSSDIDPTAIISEEPSSSSDYMIGDDEDSSSRSHGGDNSSDDDGVGIPDVKHAATFDGSKSTDDIPTIKKKTSKKKKKQPRRHSSGSTASVNNNYCCCPFRDYTRLAKTAPKGAVTIVHLRKLLRPYGCSELEIGQVFFHLDIKDVGYFYPSHDDNHERCIEAITKYTTLSFDRAKEIVSKSTCPNSISKSQSPSKSKTTATTAVGT